MGFGDTAKKLQTVADTAEKLYTRLNELRDQIQELRRRVEETSDKADHIERKMAGQRALLVALAEAQGIDADAVVAETAIDKDETEPLDAAAPSDGNTTAGQASGDTTGDVATNDDGTAVTAGSNEADKANERTEASRPNGSDVAENGGSNRSTGANE